MLEVANPSAVVALIDVATAGASPRVNGLLHAPPAAGGVLALLGPRETARDEPHVIVVSAHVDLGADVGRDQQG